MESPNANYVTAEKLRRFVLLIILLSLLGTGVELLLVEHYEDAWQWTPLILIPLAVLTMIWLMAAGSAKAVRAWQALMVLFVISGFVGIELHWNGKMEFKQESNPSLTGWALFREAMSSQSPPALAPGIMIQAGLLGLACTYRHPVLHSANKSKPTGEDK